MSEPSAIPRIEVPTAEAFRDEYFLPGRPVVITGGARGWAALETWSEESLARAGSNPEVPVDVYSGGDFFSTGGALGHRRRMKLPFAEYLRTRGTAGGERYYAPDLALERYFPELACDVSEPSFLPAHARPRLFLFAGHDAITAGHFHPFTHALTCQVIGRKRVVVYPPEAGADLYPQPWFAPAFHWSRVDFSKPDHRRFPRLGRAPGAECILSPGDALFIPVHHWHWTQGFDFSASLLVSFEARLGEWHFPTPGLACLFARAAWPIEERLWAVARRGRDTLHALGRRARG